MYNTPASVGTYSPSAQVDAHHPAPPSQAEEKAKEPSGKENVKSG